MQMATTLCAQMNPPAPTEEPLVPLSVEGRDAGPAWVTTVSGVPDACQEHTLTGR